MTTETEQILPTEDQTAPIESAPVPEVEHLTFDEAGRLAARAGMKAMGRPMTVDWFHAHSPDPHDPESMAASNRPMEFWAGFHAELTTVAATA